MLNVAIIGAGFAGQKHAQAYFRLEGVQIVAIVDVNREKAELLAREVGGRAETDTEVVYRNPSIQLIDVATPTPTHTEYVIRCLEAGKHVVVEKPLAPSLSEIDQIIRAVDKSGKFLMVAHLLRFCPEYKTIRNVLQSGQLGRPLLATAQRLTSVPQDDEQLLDPKVTGGAVLDLQIHDLDMMNWIFGEPLRIYSTGIQSKYGGWDHVITQLDYHEVNTLVEASYMMPFGYPFTARMKVLCERGAIEYESRNGSSLFETQESTHFLYIHEPGIPSKPIPFEPQDAFMSEISYFAECVCTKTTPKIITVSDARLAVQTALASRESLICKRPIIISAS